MLCVILQKQKALKISFKKKKSKCFSLPYILKKKKNSTLKGIYLTFVFILSLITIGQMTSSPLVLLPILTTFNIF